MYYIGIDISKYKHDCAVIDDLGDIVAPSWSFTNDCEGFSLFKQLLDNLEGEKRIGFESTGHYGQNLKLFLESNNFTFMEFNPLLISRFVRSKSLRNTKTDSIDALSIARYVMTVEYKPYPPSFYHLDKLKSLTRFRDSLVRQRSRQLVELTNVLDKVFPEFKPFFKGRFSGHECTLKAYYFPDDKIVYKVRVSIDFLSALNADGAYKEIKRNLLRKYKNSDSRIKSTDGHESLHALIIDDDDDMLGFIDLIVFEVDDVYESELVVGYTDMDGFAKEEKKHTDDL